MEIARLPYVDEHETTIAADVDEVWRSLLESLDRGFAGTAGESYCQCVVRFEILWIFGNQLLSRGDSAVPSRLAWSLVGKRRTAVSRGCVRSSLR